MENKFPTLFLDRDGTVNVDLMHEYLSRPDQMKLIAHAGKAIVKAKQAGFKIAIVTNQAGVAKGLTPKDALPFVHRHLEHLIANEAGQTSFRFDDIQVCMHHPDEKCLCRKPGTEMLKKSSEKLSSDLEKSFFIGDRETDLLSAARFGIPSILVLSGHGKKTAGLLKEIKEANPIQIVPSLDEAVDLAIDLVFGRD